MSESSSSANSNNSHTAVLIGIALVMAVFSITVYRYYSSQTIAEDKAKKMDEKIAATDTYETYQVSPTELLSRTRENKDTVVLDIRDENAYLSEHLIDAKSIPGSKLIALLATMDKTRTYVLVDDSGNMAPSLAHALVNDHGFKDVQYLSGGFYAWKDSFYPTIADGDPYSITDQTKVKYIKSDELKKIIDDNQKVYIIDLRNSDAYKEGHIKDAKNIYLPELETKRDEIPRGSKIILYDRDGLWAFKAAVRLFDLGIFDVQALADGLDTWKQKGYEVVQ